MLRNSFPIARIAGIEIGVHASWLIVFGLVTWSLAVGFFPGEIPGLSPLEAWVLGAVSALLLFGSVLVHELAHSFVARAQGLEARSITLFIFGGVSNVGGQARRPLTEFAVAIVGPLTSFAIGALCWVVSAVVAGEPRLATVARYLALINLLLGAFNLVPGFPLDGGRVLRAIAWNVTGSMRRGTEIAVAAGHVVGYGIMILGFLELFAGEPLSGLWLAAIGWFLSSAATASLDQVRFEGLLRDVRVGAVMSADTTTVSPETTIVALIEHYLLPGNRRAMPVARDGQVVGMITLGDIQRVPAERREQTQVGEVMGGAGGLVAVRPNDRVIEAFEALGAGDFEQLPVLDDGRLVGVISRADIFRQLQLREALGVDREA